MPFQTKLGQNGRTHIKDRFKVLDISAFFIVVIGIDSRVKEIARRHLFRVAYNDQLFTSVNSTNSILREYL